MQVSFEGIDWDREIQKSERSDEERKYLRRQKKARKLALARRKEEIGYFLSFLQTYDANALREKIQEDRPKMAHVKRMFRDLESDQALDAFMQIVSELKIPKEGSKRKQERQLSTLDLIQGLWEVEDEYDISIDRFLQFLRKCSRKRTLGLVLVSVRGDDGGLAFCEAQGLVASLGNLDVLQARTLDDISKQRVSRLMTLMGRSGAYKCDRMHWVTAQPCFA